MSKKFKKYLLTLSGLAGSATVTLAAACGGGKSSSGEGNNTGGGSATTPGNPGNPGSLVIKSDLETATQEDRIQNAQNDKNNRSHGQKEKKDSNGNRYIKLGITFSQSGVQGNTIRAIVDVYNDLVSNYQKFINDNQNATDEQKEAKLNELGISAAAEIVRVDNYGNSYPDGVQNVGKQIAAIHGLKKEEQQDYYNLLIGYPVIASVLNSNGENLLLNFNSQDKSLNTDLDDFAKSFVNANYTTENITKPGTYILPLFKSSNVLSINAPVLGYFLNEMKAKGVKISNEFNDIIDKSHADHNSVTAIWGAPVANAQDILKNAGYLDPNKTITKDDLFGTYTGIINFSKTMQSLFTNSAKTNDTSLHVFGIDDMVGVYDSALFSSLGADYSKMISTAIRQNDKTVIQYNALKSKGSDAYTVSQQIWDKFTEGFETKAIYGFPGGQYSSTDQIKHKIAFSIGSTAGYSKNYKDIKNDGATEIDDKSGNFSFEPSKSNTFTFIQNPTFKKNRDGSTSAIEELYNKYKSNILAVYGDFKNFVWSSIPKDDKGNDISIGKYDLLPADDANKTKIENLKTSAKNLGYIVSLKDNPKNTNFIKKAKDMLKDKTDSKVEIIDMKNSSGDSFAFVILKDVLKTDTTEYKDYEKNIDDTDNKFTNALNEVGLHKRKLNATDVLSEDELFALPTPKKWSAKSTDKNVLYLQGPSLMGVKSNDIDEDATRAFVKWLITTTKTFDFKVDKNTITNTPLRTLEQGMSYISGTNDLVNLDPDKFAKTKSGTNKYLQVVLAEAKEAINKPDEIHTFEEPAGTFSDTFREQIKNAWKQTIDQYNFNNPSQEKFNFTKFVDAITIGVS
ncbi:P68 family surface lipoprotein [Mycoplasma sp. 6243]|uniref:P68 family surface lipoprotein n=1 Tax=Mycoplasma sp. 6243 TaxID=3440865 RepID=UPI003EB7A994